MESNVFYKESVYKDLKHIGTETQKKIYNKILNELASGTCSGKALTGDFKGLYSLRLSDYRIIYTRISEGILILKVGHRKDIYRKLSVN